MNIKESQVAEYEQLILELRNQAKYDQDTIIRLEKKVADYEAMQENCSRLLDDTIKKDYSIENWKHRYKLLMQDHEQLDKQNKVFREALKICL